MRPSSIQTHASASMQPSVVHLDDRRCFGAIMSKESESPLCACPWWDEVLVSSREGNPNLESADAFRREL
jgi:hypothetical protein